MSYEYQVEVSGVDGYNYTSSIPGTYAPTKEQALAGLTAYCNTLAASGKNQAAMRIHRNAKCVEIRSDL